MVAPSIEQLKTQYTDKYVKVDAARPELARFRDVVGQVKTVNMSGRALVEFLDYHLNIGWFDIDVSALTVVDKPAPKEAVKEKKAEAKKPAAKPAAAPAGEKKLSPLEMARAQGAAKPAAGKSSTADILAAARAKAGAAPAESKPAAAPAAEKPAAAAAPAKAADRSKMSVADMLAAARANKPEEAAAAPAAEKPAAPPAAEKPAAPPAASAPAPAPESGAPKRVDKSTMSVDDMIAYCRKTDAK